MGTIVHAPSSWATARVVRFEGFTSAPPHTFSPAMRMTKAVAVHTTIVSMKTPRDWMRPWRTGWDTVAVAAALGAVPWPASLEKRPRLVPLIIAAMMPPPRPPTVASIEKAEVKIWPRTVPNCVMFMRQTMATMMT